MRYTGVYAVLLVLHLLTVAFLVGPAAMATMASPRQVRAGDAGALRASARVTRGYTTASVVTVLLGSAMVGLGDVGEQWSMSQPWIVASWVLSIAAVALTLAVVAPAQDAAAQALDGGGDASSYAGRIAAAGGVATLCWAAVIALMVTKPGL